VKAEYLGAGKADDKAEHLLLVGREGGGLCSTPQSSRSAPASLEVERDCNNWLFMVKYCRFFGEHYS
jgi:hypothetical protein